MKLGAGLDKKLMAEGKKICEKSKYFNFFICDKRPEHERARKTHRKN